MIFSTFYLFISFYASILNLYQLFVRFFTLKFDEKNKNILHSTEYFPNIAFMATIFRKYLPFYCLSGGFKILLNFDLCLNVITTKNFTIIYKILLLSSIIISKDVLLMLSYENINKFKFK